MDLNIMDLINMQLNFSEVNSKIATSAAKQTIPLEKFRCTAGIYIETFVIQHIFK